MQTKGVTVLECTYLPRKNYYIAAGEKQDKMIAQVRRINNLSGHDLIQLIDNLECNGTGEIAVEIMQFKGII
jgi:hypothetical protein